ncbi:MAG: hypothetical protein ACYDEF_11195 [Methanosarcina sp.]
MKKNIFSLKMPAGIEIYENQFPAAYDLSEREAEGILIFGIYFR